MNEMRTPRCHWAQMQKGCCLVRRAMIRSESLEMRLLWLQKNKKHCAAKSVRESLRITLARAVL